MPATKWPVRNRSPFSSNELARTAASSSYAGRLDIHLGGEERQHHEQEPSDVANCG